MEFSWAIFGLVVLGNFAWVGVMFLAQELDKSLPPRRSLIPGTRQPFLYMWDWYTILYGDTIAVPLIVNAYMHLVAYGHISAVQSTISALLAMILTVVGIVSCLGPNHKPDQGFPEVGRISAHGLIHMPYFGAGWSMGAVALCHWLFLGHLSGPVLWLGLFGGVLYLFLLAMEFKSGNFDPLKIDLQAEADRFEIRLESEIEKKAD